MNRHLTVLFACLFVVMVGFGITIPVLPFYAERLALQSGASRGEVTLHVTLLTSIYALMQLIFAPAWGHWSDKFGRRKLVLVGMAGLALTQVLFGMAGSLWLLYLARVAGGILSSAIFPAAAAYVSDATPTAERNRSMAWLGGAVSLGTVAGMALGGMSTQADLHFFYKTFWHFKIDGFSVPFFAAGFLMLVTLCAAARWLPATRNGLGEVPQGGGRMFRTSWWGLVRKIRLLLSLATASQFGLAMFEAIFALYAQAKMGYGPREVGLAFIVCGLTMAVFQVITVGYLSKYIYASYQIALGFSLMGIGIALQMLVHAMPAVFGSIFVLALGMSMISPNIAALISIFGGHRAGAAVGMQIAAENLGQVGGPLIGGALFAWKVQTPYLVAGVSLFGFGLLLGLWENLGKVSPFGGGLDVTDESPQTGA